MDNALKLMVFLLVCSGAFFALDKLLAAAGVTNEKTKNALAIGGVVTVVVAFGLIFGFEGGYQVPDWSDRARR